MWRRAAATAVVVAAMVTVGLLGIGPAAAAELTVSPASGPPGTEIVVTGTGFAALPVEIRWGGLSGPVIATTEGPSFSVTATVPDSLPNSVPVMAVITNGNSVSTSSASFQVTSGAAPPPAPAPEPVVEETTTSSSTTVATPPATSPAASVPSGEVGRAPVRSGSGLSGGVDGGVGTESAGPTNGGSTPSAPSAGAGGATVTSTATNAPAVSVAGGTIPTVTLAPAGAPAPAPAPAAGGQGVARSPLAPSDGVAAPALNPSRTSQSSGAVKNPVALFVGLGLVFGGGVFLAVRNRQRA